MGRIASKNRKVWLRLFLSSRSIKNSSGNSSKVHINRESQTTLSLWTDLNSSIEVEEEISMEHLKMFQALSDTPHLPACKTSSVKKVTLSSLQTLGILGQNFKNPYRFSKPLSLKCLKTLETLWPTSQLTSQLQSTKEGGYFALFSGRSDLMEAFQRRPSLPTLRSSDSTLWSFVSSMKRSVKSSKNP